MRASKSAKSVMRRMHVAVYTGTLRIFGELVQKLRRKSLWTPKNAECPCVDVTSFVVGGSH
jgi:hypothetical protein